MAIMVTEKAATEVKRMMEEQKFEPDTFLRVAIAAGGCSGFEYKFAFDKQYDADADLKMEHFGLPVVVDKKSDLYLDGATLDFSDDINARGFRFSNPHEAKGCGCGKSFSV
ncbi:MAG: iron-sulfur cluster assembly accessory protein [Planctomycetaceae bacterium]|nr:iron-sulfur cluster assembly accessory protein [Planctomycetaceae bacterium]